MSENIITAGRAFDEGVRHLASEEANQAAYSGPARHMVRYCLDADANRFHKRTGDTIRAYQGMVAKTLEAVEDMLRDASPDATCSIDGTPCTREEFVIEAAARSMATSAKCRAVIDVFARQHVLFGADVK